MMRCRSTTLPRSPLSPSVSDCLSAFRKNGTGALCYGTASCPFPRPQWAPLETCFLRQTGGGVSGVEIPCKEL